MKNMILAIIETLKQMLGLLEKEEPVQLDKLNRNRNALYYASKELGTKEAAGSKDNPRVVEYHAYSTKDNKNGMADSVPWCASFVCWVVEHAGMGSTNSKMARSFEKWGVSTKSKPLPGDIVTFYRNGKSSGQGHVAFFLKKTASYVYCLGGNQSDEVNITRYSTARMTDIRRSSKASYTAEEKEDLVKLAAKIMDGKSVSKSGKVT